MQWNTHTDRSGFSVEHPSDWSVEVRGPGLVMIASPDRRSLALIQMMAAPLPGPPVQILRNGWFSAAGFFHNAQLGEIEEGGPGAAACEVAFYLPEGTPAKAWVACRADSKGGATIVARCAPANRYLEDEPVLAQITKTFREPARPAGGPPTPAAYPQDGVSYTRFTDPQAGTFTVDVPQGWDVRGGLNHFNLGDRRMFVEARSPEGILALYGDPDCPQSFYHTQMSFEGLPIPSATGCVFLNLPASSKKLTAYYLKNVAPKRLGAFRVIDERERPDIIQAALRRIQEMGIAIPRTLKMTTNEVRIEASGRIGSCLGASMCDTAHSFGLGEPWEGSVTIWLAPPHLANVAEQVARRMIDTFLPTPRLAQIVQQDEMMIASNGASANIGQQQWFAAQQAGHAAQVGFGDALVGNYWQQQASNEQMTQNWSQNQAANDRVFQGYSDSTLDRQRLYDDATGKPYEANGAYNHYWVDQQTGQVIGTNSADPPDYAKNYTPLRKL